MLRRIKWYWPIVTHLYFNDDFAINEDALEILTKQFKLTFWLVTFLHFLFDVVTYFFQIKIKELFIVQIKIKELFKMVSQLFLAFFDFELPLSIDRRFSSVK